MRGFPKHINTKADIEYLTNHPEYSEQMKTKLEVMAQDSKKWVAGRELAAKENVTVTEAIKIIEEKQPDGTIKKYLCELKDDPNAVLKRLGIDEDIKVDEVEEFQLTETSIIK